LADVKISGLPASTVPLAGTEVLPIVQGGATKQVSIANITADRAISAASVTASTGNFVVGTSGQGIDFSATPGTGTSELLADYEEGTWTPVIRGSSTAGVGTYSVQAASYSKIGNRVLFSAYILWSAHTGTGNMRIGGLPFTIANSNNNYGAVNVFLDGPLALTAGNILQMRTTINTTDLFPGQYLPGGTTTSQLALPSTAAIMINGHYYV
jgi:hypothetical protein